ncbi:hypothetical protein M8J77_004536 [Diaphorina citri]|nr:hypothetical protein M8J77_004536 [Diaphorina citri]
MWLYRRIQRISWTEHITNEKVLRRMKKEKRINEHHQDPEAAVLRPYHEERDQILPPAADHTGENRRKERTRKKKNILATQPQEMDRQNISIAVNKVKLARLVAHIRTG